MISPPHPPVLAGSAWSSAVAGLGEVSRWVIVCDENTASHCLPYFTKTHLRGVEPLTLKIQTGEQHKNIEQVQALWQQLLDAGLDRQAVVVALGGGVVCDLAGFVAATFKRGIRLVNVPTTHLAMCDAALGGKNGINLGTVKNQVGAFHQPEAVLLDTYFLATLPENQLRSGFAETIKHALIADKAFWEEIKGASWLTLAKSEDVVLKSAAIKLAIAARDPHDTGLRQSLNFGHTAGHALEAQAHIEGHPLAHGDAVAIGMVAETYLSSLLAGLPQSALDEIAGYIKTIYRPANKPKTAQAVRHALNDKKNSGGKIRCALIPNIGESMVGIAVEEQQLAEAIDFAHGLLMA